MEPLFDFPYVCPSCGDAFDHADDMRPSAENAEGCIYCWTNPACPAGCSDDHAEPGYNDANERGQWECPETGDPFRYIGTARSGAYEPDRWDEGSVDMDGEWVSPDDVRTCDCGDVHWAEESYTDDYGDSYCSESCARRYGSFDEPEYDEDDEIERSYPTASLTAPCGRCQAETEIAYWNPVSEAVYGICCARFDPAAVAA